MKDMTEFKVGALYVHTLSDKTKCQQLVLCTKVDIDQVTMNVIQLPLIGTNFVSTASFFVRKPAMYAALNKPTLNYLITSIDSVIKCISLDLVDEEHIIYDSITGGICGRMSQYKFCELYNPISLINHGAIPISSLPKTMPAFKGISCEDNLPMSSLQRHFASLSWDAVGAHNPWAIHVTETDSTRPHASPRKDRALRIRDLRKQITDMDKLF